MLAWYALHVRSNSEDQISRHLESRQVESYYPHRIVPAAHAKRQTVLKFFPGYLFSKFDLAEHVYHPAIIRIITDGVEPFAISDGEIASIKLMVNAPVDLRTGPPLTHGDRVRVKNGRLLAGVEGIVEYRIGDCLVKVTCNCGSIGSVTATVDAACLELIEPPKAKAA